MLSLPVLVLIPIDALQKHPEKILYTSCISLEVRPDPYQVAKLEELGVNWRPLSKCKRLGGWIHVWTYKDDIRWNYHNAVSLNRFDFADQYGDYYPISSHDFLDQSLWGLPLWLISVVLNYILFGSARLLPWKGAVISEETQ
jgi:hypothetical protein